MLQQALELEWQQEDERLRGGLERLLPVVPPADRETHLERMLGVLPSFYDGFHWATDPELQAFERVIRDVWQRGTTERAAAYVQALLPVLRSARLAESDQSSVSGGPVRLPEPYRFGSYVADEILGHGGDGVAFHARDVETGQEVTIKQPARADGHLLTVLGDDWHPSMVRTLDGEREQAPGYGYTWIAREYGDETLHHAMPAHGGLPLAEALVIFRTCCEVVAWLHARRIYRWSAHTRNVLRFGDSWKVSDFGRCAVFVAEDHWTQQVRRLRLLAALGIFDEDALPGELLDAILSRFLWGHPTGDHTWPYFPARERRLKADDCAMLAGLLCVLLSGRRWEWFFRALNKRPYCSARYAITRDHDVDRQLSAVVNRAWRGDAGGALLLANDGHCEQTTYEAPAELFADVAAVLSGELSKAVPTLAAA